MAPKVLICVTLAALAVVTAGCDYFHDAPPERYALHTAYEYPALAAHRGEDGESVALIELTEESQLPDYLAYAAMNNASLEAAFNRWKAALEEIPQVRSLPDPRFTYRYYIQEVETRVGPQRQGLALSQTFPWLGTLDLRGDAAAQAAEVQRHAFEAEKLRVFFVVKDAYYDYYFLWRSTQIVQENIELLTSFEAVLRTRYEASRADHPDLIRIQVELGRLEDRLNTLMDLREPMVARLNAALNRPTDADLPWPTELEATEVTLDEQQLLAWMEQHNPDLQALAAAITRSETEIELARREYFPDVTLGFEWIETGSASGSPTPSDSGQDAMMASVSVNVPIWYDRLDAGLRQAQYEAMAAEADSRQRRHDLAADIRMGLYEFCDTQRRISLFRDTLLPKSLEALSVTEMAFRAGEATFMDLLDAQRVYLEFQLSYERALTEHQRRLAQLEMIVGRELGYANSLPTPEGANAANEPLIAD
jgi:cobalt-zinc-cadmium efflux system outer membrane protein